MDNKLALAMIVKGTEDEAPLLAKCLESISEHVDAIYINLNIPKGEKVSVKTRNVAEKYTDKIFTTEWTGNFVKARSFIFDKVPKKYNWIIWVDSDDTVENPEKIRDIINVAGSEIKGIYVQYDYAHDDFGNCTVTHWVARLCRNDGSYKWESSMSDEEITVHETLVPTRTVGKRRCEEFKIVHNSNSDRRADNLKRNIQLLEGMYSHQLENKKLDPRTMYYLATHYFDAGRYNEMEELLVKYLQVSGWAEERSEAWVYLGLYYKPPLGDRIDAARQCFLRALGENPRNPRPYVELGELEYQDKRYLMAEDWLLMAINKKEPETTAAVMPMENTFTAFMLLAQVYINMGFSKTKDALKYVNKALEYRPTDPIAKGTQELVEKLMKVRNRTQAILRLARMFEEAGQPDKIMTLLKNLPEDMQDNPATIALRQKFQKPKKWPARSIAIVCGSGPLGMWGPWSLKEGIGGSEEAVIRLTKELYDLGWQVTVFGTPGARAGKYNGIDWKQYWELNMEDEFDVLVSWRNPSFYDVKFKARKTYLWVHDALNPGEFPDERLNNIDKVIFLSKYQRSLYPNVPDDKVFLSANGITAEEFEGVKVKRDPYRIIYMSSHVRGLEMLYNVWEDVKKAVPKAKLDVYYGRESFDSIHRDNPERMAWMDKMEHYAQDLDGVTDHGKISQPQIVKEIFKSGVWAYPCPFPEISCITAMKAQAGGAIPVSSDFAALNETIQWGTKIHMKQQDESIPVGKWDKSEINKFKLALIDMLGNPKEQEAIRPKMMAWSRENQTWRKVAEGWTKQMM